MTKPSLLVLAAGMGSRYGGLKQIDPVGPAGQTIIDYSIYDALRAGFAKLVFVIRRDLEHQFRELVGQRFERRLPVRELISHRFPLEQISEALELAAHPKDNTLKVVIRHE